MNFPPLPLLFFIDARLKGKAEEKNQREKKAITSVKNLRQEEIISMFEFTSLQFSVIFTLFFCSLVVKSMMMVWLKAKAINVCKFSLSLPFRINLTFSCSLYFHATTLFYELSRTKNHRVFMSSLKLFHFHVMPHKNFSTAILNSNHVGGLN